MTDAVVVDELVKRYGPGMPAAVDGLDFAVRRGEVFGLLGPNGAGKTTTIGVLTTRVKVTSGHARVAGIDVMAEARKARAVLGVVPQHNNLDRSLNVRQNLLYHAAYHGIGRTVRKQRADALLDRMGLTDRASASVDALSGGQAQRVMIARALMHEPQVLFLDEPSVGLDPQARLYVHEKVAALRADGVTVVITTHDMDEAAKVCDRVGILDHGRLLQLDTPAAMTASLPGSNTLTVAMRVDEERTGAVMTALGELDNVVRVEPIAAGSAAPAGPPPMMMMMFAPPPPPAADRGTQFRLYTTAETSVVVPMMLKVLADLGCEITDITVSRPSLEDVYLHLTGRELR